MSRNVRRVIHLVLGGLIALVSGAASVAAQGVVQTSVSISEDGSSLVLELADGTVREIELEGGRLVIDGQEVGSYPVDGTLERAWRDLLGEVGDDLNAAWPGFAALELGASDAGAFESIREAITPLVAGTAPSVSAPAVSTNTQQSVDQEAVEGGLVVHVPEVESLRRTLGRVGLRPELSEYLNGDLSAPLRIVVQADQYTLPAGARLDQSLVLVETDGVIAGEIGGNLIIAESGIVLEPTAVIAGNLISIGSELENLGATISGDISHVERNIAPLLVSPRVTIRPPAPRSPVRYVASGMGSLLRTAAVYLLMTFLGFLIIYFFRGNLEVVSDTVSYSFGRSFLTGVLAEMLVLPILVVLAVLIVTLIAVPFYVLAVIVSAVLGYLSVAHALGENLTRRRYPSWAARLRRANSYYYVLNGLVVLLGLFAIAAIAEMATFILGWANGLLIAAAIILTWVASTAGFGAVLLSRAGTQRRFARPVEVPALSRLDTLERAVRPAARASRRPTDLDDLRDLDELDDREGGREG